MASDLLHNCIAYLQRKFHGTTIHREAGLRDDASGEIMTIWPVIAHDFGAGVKHRSIAIPKVSSVEEVSAVCGSLERTFQELDEGVLIEADNANQRSGHPMNTTSMVFAPKIILYAHEVEIDQEEIIEQFTRASLLVEIVSESSLYYSVFISFGGPDEEVVGKLEIFLSGKGLKTWFFPKHSIPGRRLHRTMHEAVNEFDRVLLVCSKSSLSRPGVLNELERVLEREAREGGSELLIPITLDDYVYTDWAPKNEDVAVQIRDRVIMKFDPLWLDEEAINENLQRLLSVFEKRQLTKS